MGAVGEVVVTRRACCTSTSTSWRTMYSSGYSTPRRWPIMILLLLALALLNPWITTTQALDISQCRVSLGMQSGKILEDAITSSSSYDLASVGPKNARIRTEQNGGAWCPKQQITREVYEYLQVDLKQLTVITLVETQGRFGNGQGQEYAEQYLLEYQRVEGGQWIRFRNRRGQEVFQGNTNTYIAELREVVPPIIARKIRFIPYSDHPRTICMRVELYGCVWKDGVVSYNTRQGDRRGSEVDLYDFTYDGKIEDNYLSGGLGQLTDGDEGQSNFRLDPQGLGMKGYEWVGWKNDTVNTPPVEIIFQFDTVRNFSLVKFHCNNMFSKDIRVFKMASIYFSVGGKWFQQDPIHFHFMRDGLIEFARMVMIPLQNRVGRAVKVALTFDARWVMVSEVQFESEPTVGNFTDEVAPPATLSTRPTHPGGVYEVDANLPHGHGANPKTTTEVNQTREKNTLDDEYIGIIIGALAALILLLFIVVFLIILRYRRRKHNNNHRVMKPVEPRHVTLNLNDLRPPCQLNGKVSNGNMYNSVATSDLESDCVKIMNNREEYNEPLDCIQGRKLPELPKTPESSDTYTSREYAVPDITKSSLIVNLPPAPNKLNLYEPPSPKTDPTFYAASDIIQMPNIQGVSGNNVYAVPNPDLLTRDDYSIMEFPRDHLKFIEKLGEGQFGEVHLCEALRIQDFLGDDFLINRTSSRSMLVAVKTLRRNADEQARSDFHKEVKIMSRLKDPNIVLVLGVCTREEPLCMIVEYMKYGDLNQYLLERHPEGTLSRGDHVEILSYGALIYMASQIAAGMKYLESLNMVHRDLATRNCLVGQYYGIKISDFGMSRSLYSADYYRIEGRAVLPIRWMAWESILLGKFTTKSDVWSFGVTLWEVLTYARGQPYDGMTDEQVIENCGHYYRNDNKELYLPQPEICPREIYDLMRECWNRNEIHRPAFREIHMFLQRKNMGYNPKDDTMGNGTLGNGTLTSLSKVPVV